MRSEEAEDCIPQTGRIKRHYLIKTATEQTLHKNHTRDPRNLLRIFNSQNQVKMVGRVEMSGDVEVIPNGEENCKPKTPATRPRRTRGASVTVGRYSVNYGIPSRKSVHDFVILEHGPDSWRVKIHEFLEQKWVEWALLGLLCLDIIIIFTEMFLMTEYPYCGIVERDCLACCPYEKDAGDAANRWLAESYCDAGYDVTGFASCDDHKWAGVHKIETVLFSCTIIILR